MNALAKTLFVLVAYAAAVGILVAILRTVKKWLKLAAYHGHTEAAKLLSVKSY